MREEGGKVEGKGKGARRKVERGRAAKGRKVEGGKRRRGWLL